MSSYICFPRNIINKNLIQVGKNCRIGKCGVMEEITKNGAQNFYPTIILDDDVYEGRYCQLYCVDSVRIGDGFVLSEYVYISDSAHGFDPYGGWIMQHALESKGSISIRKNFRRLWGFYHARTDARKKMHRRTRSVVTKSFSPYTMLAASPAKIIKSFDFESGKWIPV